MKAIEEKNYAIRKSKTEHYDKRLIQEILNQVYAGVPRKLLVSRYQLGQSTIHDWLQRYGTNEDYDGKRNKYSKSLKRSVVTSVESGRMTIREAQISFGIKSRKSIREWMALYESEKSDLCLSKPDEMASKKTPKKSDDVEALRKELELAQLKIKALNTMIDIAEDQLKINIRKKSGAKQSDK